MNLNKVFLGGNCTRDPETRYLPSNTAVTAFGLATNRRWTDAKTGEVKEETTFIDCEAFGKVAELIGQHFRKGKPIYCEGRLKLDQFQTKEGEKRSKLKVIVESFQFIDSRPATDTEPAQGGTSRPTGNRPAPATRTAPASTGTHQPIGDDQIPF